MAQIIYNSDSIQDVIQVLHYIDQFTIDLGVRDVVIDLQQVQNIVTMCNNDTFPHNGGVEKASVFKKVANFVCHFIAARPIQDTFLGYEFSKIENHQNVVVAFEVARRALYMARIHRSDGEVVGVDNWPSVSMHSYIDIIEALSKITPAAHFHTLTVFFEQLVYKTNPHCQYPLPDEEKNRGVKV